MPHFSEQSGPAEKSCEMRRSRPSPKKKEKRFTQQKLRFRFLNLDEKWLTIINMTFSLAISDMSLQQIGLGR